MGKSSTAVKPARKRRGYVALAEGPSATRTFTLVILNFLHRTDEIRRASYGNDLNLAAIGETVGVTASEPSRRDPAFQQKFADLRAVMGIEGQRAVNALSIAHATGMPRETVRRRLHELVKRGVLLKVRGGYVTRPGFVQTSANLALAERAMREAVHFINECFNFGLVEWKEKPRLKATSGLSGRRSRSGTG
jgi:hypothetical protein